MIFIRTQPIDSTWRPIRLCIAGAAVLSDVSATWLEPFVDRRAEVGETFPAREAERPGPGDARSVFRGTAWLAGETRSAACTVRGETYCLAVDGSRPFLVGRFGRWIAAEPLSSLPLDETELQVLFGPALLLALARFGTFALHASAVATASGVAAFVGESGTGKSTLARPVGRTWRRLADDIVPVTRDEARVVALPRFPQLKLPPVAQYPASAPDAVPLAAVYAVESTPPRGDVEVVPLSAADGALVLLAHTVAARTFGPDLLERHLVFCTEAATGLRVCRLRVPRRLEALPAVRAAVRADLRAIAWAP